MKQKYFSPEEEQLHKQKDLNCEKNEMLFKKLN